MDSLLVSKSMQTYHTVKEPTYEPPLDSYHNSEYEDMLLLEELPSPPDSPRSSERSESPLQPEYESYKDRQKLSPAGKKLCKLLQIRKMLLSRTGSEIRDEIIQLCGTFTVPVHDHLNYKNVKNVRN